jgi:CheY-like chemotaxis protein
MDQLLSDNHFERSRTRVVDAHKVDQNEMLAGSWRVRVGASDRRPHPAAEPAFKNPSLGRNAKSIDRQIEKRQIPFEKLLCLRVIDLRNQEGELPGRHQFIVTTASRRRAWRCVRDPIIIAHTRHPFSETARRIAMSPALQRPHVLVVTDDRELSDFLGEGLVYAGFWTSTIASALQALEVFRLRSFDAMVLDAALGGIGATELLRRLRGHSDRATGIERTDIPILVIAGTESELDLVGDHDAGIDQVILAPIELEDLAAKLGELVTTWRASHPGRQWADEAALGPA